MFSLANKLSLASLTFKPTPPVPERKVISTLQIALAEIHPEMAAWRPPRPHAPLVCGSALDQRSHSAGPVIIQAAEGAEPPSAFSTPSPATLAPDARSTSPR